MKLARLVLAAVAASTLGACTADSPTAPTAPPSRSTTDSLECTEQEAQVQDDGSIIFVCSPGQGGSGG